MAPDEQAFTVFYRRHHGDVERYVRRRLAGDAVRDTVADVFLVAWRRFSEVPPEAALPWLYAVARHTLANEVRGARRAASLRARIEQQPEVHAGDPADRVAGQLALLEVFGGPAGVFNAVTDLCREQVLTPPQRAALLRSLATVPGLRAAGSVTDRSGRHGEAFLLDSPHGGLPTQYTVIVDPATGRLLGWEQMLTEDAGRLNVRIPAVLTYETLTQSEYTSTDGE